MWTIHTTYAYNNYSWIDRVPVWYSCVVCVYFSLLCESLNVFVFGIRWLVPTHIAVIANPVHLWCSVSLYACAYIHIYIHRVWSCLWIRIRSKSFVSSGRLHLKVCEGPACLHITDAHVDGPAFKTWYAWDETHVADALTYGLWLYGMKHGIACLSVCLCLIACVRWKDTLRHWEYSWAMQLLQVCLLWFRNANFMVDTFNTSYFVSPNNIL